MRLYFGLAVCCCSDVDVVFREDLWRSPPWLRDSVSSSWVPELRQIVSSVLY